MNTDFSISVEDLKHVRGQATLEEVAIIAASLEYQKRIASMLPEYTGATPQSSDCYAYI